MNTPEREELAAMRRSYRNATLDESVLAPDWHTQFHRWLSEAVQSLAFPEPNAMVIATATPDAVPSARTVLLKACDERGLVFFTSYSSRKGAELAANPKICCVFPWMALERQVVVSGSVRQATRAESDEYFHSRPHGSQLAASISEQSQVIADRAVLETARDRLAARYPEGSVVPTPESWGGYRVVPDAVEFWQGREDRLHDRLRYRRLATGEWVIERLAP